MRFVLKLVLCLTGAALMSAALHAHPIVLLNAGCFFMGYTISDVVDKLLD